MFENEEFLPVAELPHYLISNRGRVKHAVKGNLLKTIINDRGFPVVTLYGADSRTRNLRQINVLVARAFLDPPTFEDETQVWHIDGALSNCSVENLKWETRSRVLQWNEMQRRGGAEYQTPRVRNNRTGEVYASAYECALAEGELESTIVWKIERGSPRYCYIGDNDL